MEMPDVADGEAAQPLLHLPRIVFGFMRRTAGISRIMPGHHAKQQRVIGDRARHRPDMIQSEGKREDASARDQAISRLHADNAAMAGRVAHRTAGIGTKRSGQNIRPNGGAGTGRRTARMMRRIPRVARGREGQIKGRAANGEFMRGELGRENRTRRAQPRHHRRIGAFLVIQQNA